MKRVQKSCRVFLCLSSQLCHRTRPGIAVRTDCGCQCRRHGRDCRTGHWASGWCGCGLNRTTGTEARKSWGVNKCITVRIYPVGEIRDKEWRVLVCNGYLLGWGTKAERTGSWARPSAVERIGADDSPLMKLWALFRCPASAESWWRQRRLWRSGWKEWMDL